ncbi:MAG: RagB/SusD family protein [Chitinophagaceae bacterium]
MKNYFLKYAVAASLLVSAFSCKKIYDLQPLNQLDVKQAYQTVSDADAAVVGVYGKFMGLAERYILLNELRGDMVEYTANADGYLKELSTHNVSADNPWANPRPFYEVIINCNDVLANFDIMKRDNKMKVVEYNQRYSDIACLRAFLYLQLGIHYGEVPYVTDPLATVDAIRDAAKFPKLTFNTLLDSLLSNTQALPWKDPYPSGTSLNVSVDGYTTPKFFAFKKMIIGDLNLWKGNYTAAATNYREIMETATSGATGERYYVQYRLGWSGSSVDHYITYSRAGDASTLVTEGAQWRYMFERPQDNGFDYEWLWVMPFDYKFAPANPFVKLFSPIGGDYLLKPSQDAIDRWNSQTQRASGVAGSTNGLPYDARGQLSWKMIAGQPTIMKYLYNYIQNSTGVPLNPLQKTSKWFIMRQTHLHLHFAEAANRAGRYGLAFGIANQGIAAVYPSPTTDRTDYQNTLKDSYPYNFDARNGDAPYFRSDWYRNIGVRARANLTSYPISSPSDSLISNENGIIEELALENGFEGTRWPDLLRIALRRNDPAFLADKIYAKLSKDGVPEAAATRTRLMNKANWYLPFKM